MHAILRIDIALLLGRIGNEVLVLHGGGKGIAQHLQAVSRQIRWRHERPPDALPGIEKLERLFLVGIVAEVDDEWSTVKVDRWLGATVEQHIDLLAGDPVRPLADHTVKALTDTVDLVAL